MPPRKTSGSLPTPSQSTGSSRKRSAQDDFDEPRYPAYYPTPPTTAPSEYSPERRHVSFPRRLERGPTPSRSDSRPPKSALSRLTDRDIAAADQQLHLEERAALRYPPSPERWDGHGINPRAIQNMNGKQHGSNSHLHQQSETLATSYPQLDSPPTSTQQRLPDIASEEARDREVCRRVHKLRARVVDFAKAFVALPANRHFCSQSLVSGLCIDVDNAQLIRFIGCLAQGGPNLEADWENLLADTESTTALVVGILGTALRQHVFSALYFGGTPQQIEELMSMEASQIEKDGYHRTEKRAGRCIVFRKRTDPECYSTAKHRISMALEKMLTPLYTLKQSSPHDFPQGLRSALESIVSKSAELSREMRECNNVIYYWPPTFKDEEFDPERMECLNIESMTQASPYKKEDIDGRERSVLVGDEDQSQAIVKVVAFPGLVVHRQGGGALAKKQLAEERKEDPNVPPDVRNSRRMARDSAFNLTGDEGFRTRVLCKSVVHLMWGRQRLLTREAGTSVHLDAMRDGNEARYENDRRGFVELYDVFLKRNPMASAALSS